MNKDSIFNEQSVASVERAGQSLWLTDPQTGLRARAALFVAVLGASNYTNAEATRAADLPAWIGSHVRAFEYFGRVAAALIPDNHKNAVLHPDRNEPDLHPTSLDLATHYGTTILPTQVRRPRDKTKVETAVLIVERWIVAALRHRTFLSLAELNAAIGALLERLNARRFRKLPGSRRTLFETLDRPALRPLPATPYVFAEWKRAWARLIRQVYEVDPLVCPRCAGPMRIIAFIEQPSVTEKILRHLACAPP